jgi:hypothetical protein
VLVPVTASNQCKDLRVLNGFQGMRMPMPAAQGWTGRAALIVAHAASWWMVLTVAGVVLAGLAFRLLAERGRRKTLEAVFRAPANTVVVLDKGPGDPSMLVWVGEGPSPGQPQPSVWGCQRSAAQARPRGQT